MYRSTYLHLGRCLSSNQAFGERVILSVPSETLLFVLYIDSTSPSVVDQESPLACEGMRNLNPLLAHCSNLIKCCVV